MKGYLAIVAVVARGNPGPAAFGVSLTNRDTGEVFDFGQRLAEPATNIKTEYAAIIFTLQKIDELQGKKVEIQTSLQLAAQQINGAWRARDDKVALLVEQARELAAKFFDFKIKWVYSSEVATAKELASAALNS